MSGLEHRDFARLATFIQGYSGIRMPPVKKTLVEGRLRHRVKALGMADLSEYCRYLFDRGGLKDEAVHVIDMVTTNKTDFFREAQHFDYLTRHALPKLTEGRHERHLKIWSAASSTGAEAYSIAMVLADFATRQRTDFTVFATDICTDVLHKAVRAVYAEDIAAPIPDEQRRRYLMKAKDPARKEVRIAPELRQKVHFGRLNLMDSDYPMPTDMDVIFCRNVLIYFDRDTQQKVLERLCGHLRPGGYLFVGHTEALSGQSLPVTSVANAVFIRDAA